MTRDRVIEPILEVVIVNVSVLVEAGVGENEGEWDLVTLAVGVGVGVGLDAAVSDGESLGISVGDFDFVPVMACTGVISTTSSITSANSSNLMSKQAEWLMSLQQWLVEYSGSLC